MSSDLLRGREPSYQIMSSHSFTINAEIYPSLECCLADFKDIKLSTPTHQNLEGATVLVQKKLC